MGKTVAQGRLRALFELMNDDNKLRACFTNAFGSAAADPTEIGFGDSAWDSVAHIALVTEIETAFDLEMNPDEIAELTTYSKAKEILGRHGAGFGRGQASRSSSRA